MDQRSGLPFTQFQISHNFHTVISVKKRNVKFHTQTILYEAVYIYDNARS